MKLNSGDRVSVAVDLKQKHRVSGRIRNFKGAKGVVVAVYGTRSGAVAVQLDKGSPDYYADKPLWFEAAELKKVRQPHG